MDVWRSADRDQTRLKNQPKIVRPLVRRTRLRHLALVAFTFAVRFAIAEDDLDTLFDPANQIRADIESLDGKGVLTVACWFTGDGMSIRIGPAPKHRAHGFWEDAHDIATRRLRFEEGLTPVATRARIWSGWRGRYSLWFEGRIFGRGWDFERHTRFPFEVKGTDAETIFPALLRYETLRLDAMMSLPQQDQWLVKGTDRGPVSFQFHLGTAWWELTKFAQECRPARRFSMEDDYAELAE